MYWSGRSFPGAGECVRAKAAPLVYDHIVENVSNVVMGFNLLSFIPRGIVPRGFVSTKVFFMGFYMYPTF